MPHLDSPVVPKVGKHKSPKPAEFSARKIDDGNFLVRISNENYETRKEFMAASLAEVFKKVEKFFSNGKLEKMKYEKEK